MTTHTIETPGLETGWNDTTSDADNVLLDTGRTMVAAYAALANSRGARVERHDHLGLHLTDSGSLSPFGNQAHLLRPLGGPDDAGRLGSVLSTFYEQVDGGPYLVFSSWPTGDLREHGLTLAGHPSLMIWPEPVAVAPEAVTVRRVTTEAGLADFEQTLVEALPTQELWPWVPNCFFSPGVLETAWRFYVAYDDERPVAVAAGWTGERVTLVEMVATRPECRGRGLGAALTAAAAAGDRPAVLLASDDGRPVYARLGFVPLLRFTL
jgi:GNAT superfamily N-acetyltransferase